MELISAQYQGKLSLEYANINDEKKSVGDSNPIHILLLDFLLNLLPFCIPSSGLLAAFGSLGCYSMVLRLTCSSFLKLPEKIIPLLHLYVPNPFFLFYLYSPS